MITMQKKYLITTVATFGVCILCFMVYLFHTPKVTMQDSDLNTSEWTNIYQTANSNDFSIINDANNDDMIVCRILDKQQNIIQEPFAVELGEKKELLSLQSDCIIQAQAIQGNYRIRILE